MTVYTVFLECGEPDVTQNISSTDTILVTVGASYGTTGSWLSLTPTGGTINFTSGSDGSTTTFTPASGASSYSVTFRTRDTEQAVWYSTTLSGTITTGTPPPPPPPSYPAAGTILSQGCVSGTYTYRVTKADGAGGSYNEDTPNSPSCGYVAPPPPPPPPPPATTYTLTFYDSSFSAARTNFNEGEMVYAFLSTTAADGTTLYWNTSSGSDLVSPVDGSFVVSYGLGIPSFTIASDSTTEGAETLTFYIRSGSVSGTVLTSSSITINDTSTSPAPTPTYSVGNAATNEGASATVNVTTTNVANGTTLYWTVDGADVSTTSGSFAISSNAGSFTIPAIADSTTEGTEYYTISIRTGSTGGTVVASSTLTIYDTSTTALDTTPDSFTFTDQTNVALNTVITSNTITVSGINTATSISVSGGTYSINGGAYTSSTGTVTNGQTVTVRHTSSGSNSTSTNTTLTIGGLLDIFTSTTVAAAPDTVPDAFVFSNQSGVALSSTITSNGITVSGINTATSISVSGGTYSINGGAYTSATGSVTNGQTVTVQHTSSASNGTNTNTTLTIGGVSDTFISTTIGASGSGLYGLQIFDEFGNITLDTTDNTIKDFGYFSIASVTTNGTITSVPMTTNSIALVTNNNGDGDTAVASAVVTLDPAASSIIVSGGRTGFDISIRVMEF